jgi:hypothetical protein
VWDTAKRKEKILEGHAGNVNAVAFSPNGKTLASGSEDRTVKLWDLASGEVIDNLKGYDKPVRDVQYVPDGKALVTLAGESYGDAFKIKIWDVSGARPMDLPKARDLPPIWRWRIAPDSKTVALSYLDKVVNSPVVVLWDLYTGEERARAVVKQRATDMTISADGRWLAWGQEDGKVLLWEVGIKGLAAEKPTQTPGEPSTAVKALLDALTDPDSNDVRRQAAESIKKLGDKTAVGPLEDRIADDLFKDDLGGGYNSSSKCAAADALKELAPERVTPALRGALAQEKNEDVRYWACWELGQQDDKESLDALATASKADKSPKVREQAVSALVQRNK